MEHFGEQQNSSLLFWDTSNYINAVIVVLAVQPIKQLKKSFPVIFLHLTQ